MRVLILRSCAVDLATGQVSGPRPSRLTTRELALLVYLAGRAGQTVPRDQLLVEAFGYADGVSSRAVDKAMNSLRAKVERDGGAPDHLITEVGTGYRFEPLPESPLPPDAPPAPIESASPTGGLGPAVDRFYGRDDAVAAVSALLAEPGLVTVVGVGGMGKTRLALEVARDAAGPARLIELAGARDRQDLVRAAAEGLGVPLTAGSDPADQVGHALAGLGAGLVVLDNLEHLVEHADRIVHWRRLAPRLRLLATSRRPLEVPGERVFRLEPLPVDDAVALLVGRAAQRGIDVPADAATATLAARLDGLPLALELAAARLGVLGVAELTERLDQRLSLLRSRTAGRESSSASGRTSGRHATLSAALDGSWSLLDGPERTALSELSVFPRDFGAQAAEAVLSPPPDGRTALDLVDALLDASLIQRRTVEGEVRLGLLETVRLYAAERLADLDPAAAERVAGAHARYYAALGEILADRGGDAGPTRIRRLARELDHLVVTCRWAIRVGDGPIALRSLRAIGALVQLRGPAELAASLAQEVLAMPALTPRQRVEARWQVGQAVGGLSAAEARPVLELALAEAIELGDAALEHQARLSLGRVLADLGERGAARLCFEQGLGSENRVIRALHRVQLGLFAQVGVDFEGSWRLLREAEAELLAEGDVLEAANTRKHAAMAAIRMGRLEEAEPMLRWCCDVFTAFGARIPLLICVATLGQIVERRGDLASAMAQMNEAIAGFREMGDRRNLLVTLGEAGTALANHGRHVEALEVFSEAEPIARVLGDARGVAGIGMGRAYALAHLGRLDEAIPAVERIREDLRPLGVTGVSLGADLVLVEMLLMAGRRDEAAQVLHAADLLLAERGLGPQSEMGAEAARLRAML